MESKKQEYFDDPDDPPVPRIGETLFFVEGENYMTSKGFAKFDLDYMLFRLAMNEGIPYNYAQKALDESPEIPPNEYVWYFCPLEPLIVDIQIAYYLHWEHYNGHNKVSKEEISNILWKVLNARAKEIYRIIIKYDLKDSDFFWDVIGIAFDWGKFSLFEKLKEKPYLMNVPHNWNSTLVRTNEVKRLGLDRTREDAQKRRNIKKELEEA
jgi:hypothetical protein